MTTYSNRSNAARAAKKAGLEKFSITEVDGKFGFEDATPTPAPEPVKPVRAAKAPKAPKAKTAIKAKRVAKAPARKANPAVGANATIIALVTKGATISELTSALGWQAHSVRGSLSRLGAAGYTITRTKVGNDDAGFETYYKIAS